MDYIEYMSETYPLMLSISIEVESKWNSNEIKLHILDRSDWCLTELTVSPIILSNRVAFTHIAVHIE